MNFWVNPISHIYSMDILGASMKSWPLICVLEIRGKQCNSGPSSETCNSSGENMCAYKSAYAISHGKWGLWRKNRAIGYKVSKEPSFRSGKGYWMRWHLSRCLNAVRDLFRSWGSLRKEHSWQRECRGKAPIPLVWAEFWSIVSSPFCSQASRKEEYQSYLVIDTLSNSWFHTSVMFLASLTLLRRD